MYFRHLITSTLLTATALLTLPIVGCSNASNQAQSLPHPNVAPMAPLDMDIKELIKVESFRLHESNTVQLATFITADNELCRQYVSEPRIDVTGNDCEVSSRIEKYCEPIVAKSNAPEFRDLAYMEVKEVDGVFFQSPVLINDYDFF